MRRLLWARPKVSINWLTTGSLPFAFGSGMDPFRGAVGPVFLLPDGHDLLEPVDGEPACLERLAPMRATHGHGHAHLADFEMAQPMHQDDFPDRPARARLLLDLRELLFGHARVGFIIERGSRAAIGQVADGTEERDNRAATRTAHLLRQDMVVNRLGRQAVHALVLDYPPLTGGRMATSAPSERG